MTILQWFMALFTDAEWRAMAWLLLVTLAATHTLKIVWRRSPVPGGGGQQVALIAVILSVAFSYFLWPANGVPWWIAGIVGGPASNIAFMAGFALIKKLAPDIAATLNGDRRKLWGLPPKDRKPRRKEDLS